MNRDAIEQIDFIEQKLDIKFPDLYKKFLVEEIQDSLSYEIIDKDGFDIYLYSYMDILERNETNQIQPFEPDYFLIGQDGDIGYFVYVKKGSEKDTIYSLDLGALGSLDMEEAADNIYDLRTNQM
ncbi:SMI1/KNR4 family protein [Xylocopilactobacillus apicola]|uniref:SMI1/KNR4 family protein n=1 Tax=Xylocopilactobacillus apicola TaxID=2932184 RepID=A0AAU9CUH7_9LACO|nr:SMI1/KNR4 family protein [Xylocopilactobacillus apicola]BDR57659.1 hypothetical protein XA3_01000 [Xylocopilactobacillus apicola]